MREEKTKVILFSQEEPKVEGTHDSLESTCLQKSGTEFNLCNRNRKIHINFNITIYFQM